MAKTTSTDVATFDLASVQSAKDVAALFDNSGFILGQATDELGDGFVEIDKKQLIDVDMILLNWTFAQSKEYAGNEYVIVRAITRDDRKVFFTDGGSGVYKQLKTLTEKRTDQGHPNPDKGLICHGLRLSEYDYTDDAGKVSRAKTFYVSA